MGSMLKRDIAPRSVIRVLCYGAQCEPYDATGWRVFAKDVHGNVIAVGVYIENEVLVATVMWP